MIESLGGRKVLVLLFIFLLGVGAVIWKGDVPANFLTMVEWMFPMFIAGNSIEHIFSTPTVESTGEVATVSADTSNVADIGPAITTINSHIDDRAAELFNQNAETQKGLGVIQQTLSHIITKTRLDQ